MALATTRSSSTPPRYRGSGSEPVPVDWESYALLEVYQRTDVLGRGDDAKTERTVKVRVIFTQQDGRGATTRSELIYAGHEKSRIEARLRGILKPLKGFSVHEVKVTCPSMSD